MDLCSKAEREERERERAQVARNEGRGERGEVKRGATRTTRPGDVINMRGNAIKVFHLLPLLFPPLS